jgi:hypothetical protein
MHRPIPWQQMAISDLQQSERFVAESLAQLLADLLRSVLTDGSPAVVADADAVDRYRNMVSVLDPTDTLERMRLGVTRTGLAKRCVTRLKRLLTNMGTEAAGLRDFVDALALFPALFDAQPSARSRRARLTWLLTHDRRLDASTREAGMALMEACEHLGLLLWPEADST